MKESESVKASWRGVRAWLLLLGTACLLDAGARRQTRQGRDLGRRAGRIGRFRSLGHGRVHARRDARSVPVGNAAPEKVRHRLAGADAIQGLRPLQEGDGEAIGRQLLILDSLPLPRGRGQLRRVGPGRVMQGDVAKLVCDRAGILSAPSVRKRVK